MPSPTPHRTARLLATTSMIALTLATTPVTIPTLDDGAFISSAHAESCCFIGETQVILADGQSRPIASIAVGAQVMGPDGRAHRVVRVERPKLGARKLYALNGGRPFVTAEHPFMTETGWRAVDPAATFSEAPHLRVDALRLGDRLTRGQMTLEMPAIGALALAPQPRVALHHVLLEAIAARGADPGLEVFNLVLADGHSFFADGFVVHNKGGDDDGGSSGGGGSGGGGDSGGSGFFRGVR